LKSLCKQKIEYSQGHLKFKCKITRDHELIQNVPTFFAKLIFSRQNFFGILEKGNCSEQKKNLAGKKST
jgi:hypothetical protein